MIHILCVKQGGIKYHFKSLWYDATWDWSLVSGPLTNTLPTRPMCRFKPLMMAESAQKFLVNSSINFNQEPRHFSGNLKGSSLNYINNMSLLFNQTCHLSSNLSVDRLIFLFFLYLSLIGIILRWGFLIWELIFFFFYLMRTTQASQRFTWSKTWCDKQQLWKAVITGDTVTRLSIPIRGRG